MRDMQPILAEKESQKETINRLMGEIDGLIQTIEDKDPYAARKYWEWLLGEGKKKEKEKLLEWISDEFEKEKIKEKEEERPHIKILHRGEMSAYQHMYAAVKSGELDNKEK